MMRRCLGPGVRSVREATITHALMEEMARLEMDEYFYPPVVAGGARGLALHYVDNSQSVRSVGPGRAIVRPPLWRANVDGSRGEMVLIDAGGVYCDYGADITRTLPVSGRFSEPQAELYSAVLAVQEGVLAACRSGTASTLAALSAHSADLLAQELRALGIPSTASDVRRLLG
jgi:Xaa-Pro aminopeptidase